MTDTTTTVSVVDADLGADLGTVAVRVTERGDGHPILLLHGGAGPLSVEPFADLLAGQHPARVLTPTHPGFNGTPRPAGMTTVRQLADLYVAALESLDLTDVTVVGNSIGGWITAEMALLKAPRVSSYVLVDAVGIEVPDHPVVDFFALTFPQIAQRSYYNPDAFRIDPNTLPPPAQAAMAGNRETLRVYGGQPSMADPGLRARLADVDASVLVVWGDSDGVADPDYGRSFADAIPGARFELLSQTGHLPQVESPQLLLPLLWDHVTSFVAGADPSTSPEPSTGAGGRGR